MLQGCYGKEITSMAKIERVTWWELKEEVSNLEINCIIEPGLLQTGGLLSIVGKPGAGKSFLSQQIAYEVASGRRVLGLFPAVRCKVLYCETEERGQQSKIRLVRDDWEREYKGALDNLEFITHYFDLTSSPMLMELERNIVEGKFKLIILDSFTTTIGDPNEERWMRDIIMALRQLCTKLGIGFILIHHLRKPQQAFSFKSNVFKEAPITLEEIRGVYTQQYMVDTAIALEKTKESLGKRYIAFLKHSYCPILYDELIPLEYTFQGSEPVPYSNDGMELMKALDRGMSKMIELKAALNLQRHDSIISRIKRLEELGLVEYIPGVQGRGKGAEIHPVTWKGAKIVH